jgi:hypothetical protein
MMIRDTDHAWGVLVLAPPDKCSDACDQAKKAFQSVVKSLEAMVFIATAMYDGDYDEQGKETQKVFERFNLSATDAEGNVGVQIPSLVFFMPGPRGVQPSEVVLPPNVVMQLAAAKPRAIVEQIKAFFPHAMTSVTTSSIGRFLEPPATHPRRKLLVVSSKASPALQGRKLSLDALYGADTGLVMAKHSAVTDLLPGVVPGKGGIYISKVGTLPPRGTAAADVDPLSVQWIPYEGKGGAFHPMQQWVLNHLGRARIPILTSQAQFDDACVKPGGICVVAVMPRGTAQETVPEGEQLPEDSYINTMARVVERVYGKVDTGSLAAGTPKMEIFPVRFVQVDGDSQAAWASAFDVSAPSVVAVNARTKRFAAFTGAFAPPPVHDFVLDVVNGQVNLGKADAWPVLATTPPTDVIQKTREPRKLPKKAKKSKKSRKSRKSMAGKRDEL